MSHSELLLRALAAIDEVFGDTSVDRETTRSSLEELAGDIEGKLDGLDADDDTE